MMEQDEYQFWLCPWCGEEHGLEPTPGSPLPCQKCHQLIEFGIDDYYDEESGVEDSFAVVYKVEGSSNSA